MSQSSFGSLTRLLVGIEFVDMVEVENRRGLDLGKNLKAA
jgi:hypothetical protein